MKKFFKWCFILAVIFILVIVCGLITLKIMYPFDKLKAMGQDYVFQNYNRQIDLEDISFNLVGVSLKNFKLSEAGGFEKGTFVAARQAALKVEFLPLLSKQINIKTIGFDGVEINIIKDKDGNFNFANLTSTSGGQDGDSTQEINTPKEDTALLLTAKDMYIKNSDISYKDLQGGTEFTVNNVNFSIENFDYNSPFNFMLSFATSINTGSIKLNPVELSAQGKANIEGMKLEKAFIDITSFAVAYKDFKIDTAGWVKNFTKPDISLKGNIKGIDKKLLAEFTDTSDMPQFTLPDISVEAAASSDLDGSKTDLNKLNISLGKSYINSSAAVDYSGEDLVYSGQSEASINLTDVASIVKELAAAYKIAGVLNAKLSYACAKDMPSLEGTITLKDLSATLIKRPLTKLNGVITVNSLDNIRTNTITGMFDGSAFKTSASYVNKKKTSVDFMFEMDKFTLDDIDFNALIASSKEEKPQEDNAQNTQTQTVQNTQQSEMQPMDIKADILVKRVENNVFSTDNLTLKADIKDLDLKMNKATGSLYFSAWEGEIRDLDKLINSSVFMKVILTTVKISQKALKAANVISGKDIDTDKVNYHQIVGDYTLSGGIATVNKSDLLSDLATINTTGTVNFATEKLDMKVKVGLGKNASSSVAIKVGGTMSEPSYKVDVASTVSSLLGGLKKDDSGNNSVKQQAENVKSAVKDVAGGIKNLFKKK